jgi:hypothetical protein
VAWGREDRLVAAWVAGLVVLGFQVTDGQSAMPLSRRSMLSRCHPVLLTEV